MERDFLKKNAFVLLVSFALFSCSNYMGLTIEERQELKVKDTPALTVMQLPTILPCKKVDEHYELEVIVIPEKNLRFPKSGDKYKIVFDAFVTNDVVLTGLKATMMNMPNMTFDIPLQNRVASTNGRITVDEEFEFPKEIPNLRAALKNLRIVAIVESAAEDGVTFTLTKQPARHIESENVEIDYVSFEAPPAEVGEVTVTLKNADGSVFTTISGKTGERLEIPQQIPVCRGWVFKKWIGVPEIFPQKNLEIEAEWELMDYYIDYELQGGVNSAENPEYYSEEDDAIKLWPATKEGSIFEGWYTDGNFENKIEVLQTSRGEDITLYAKWIEVKIGQITLNPKTPIIVSGQKGKVEAALVMSDGSRPAVAWMSEDESLATIDENGNVVARENLPFVRSNSVASIKEVTVTATYDNLKASCKLTLIPTTLTHEIFEAIEPKYATITDYVVPEGIEELAASENGTGTFEGRANLKNVNLPDSLRIIGESAFFGKQYDRKGYTYVEGLTCNINIPKGIERIEDSAFNKFEGKFTDREIFGEKLTYIGNLAFCNSKADFSCEFPQSLLHIGDSAFYWCSTKGPLDLPSNLEYLGDYAFHICQNLTGSVIIPGKITRIPKNAFYYCSSLSGNLQIHDHVTEIGERAFAKCSNLTGELKLPKNLETLESEAFYNCEKLTGSIEIPEKVTEIENCVFYKCRSLDGTISIHSNVTAIGSEAFSCCSSLEEVRIPGNGAIKSIYGDLFDNICAFYNSATIVTITGSLPSNRWDAKKWNSEVLFGFPELKKLQFENGVPPGYKLVDGALLSSDGKKLVYVPRSAGVLDGDGVTVYIFPDSVKEIGDYAMYGIIGRRMHTNWNNITRMGDYALGYANATMGKVYDNLKYIGKGAFVGGYYAVGKNEKRILDFSSKKGWYLTTDPNATSGTAIDVSNAETNFEKLMGEYGDWTGYYLKRN